MDRLLIEMFGPHASMSKEHHSHAFAHASRYRRGDWQARIWAGTVAHVKHVPASDLHWDDLRHFLAVARAGSFSEAARQSGVEQSTLSRRVASLERALGTPLLLRGARQVALTPAGRLLLPEAAEMESRALVVSRLRSASGSKTSGTVRLSTTSVLAALLAGRLAAHLRAHWPGLVLELGTSARLADLARAEADLALRMVAPRKGSAHKGQRVGYVRFGAFASPAFLARHGSITTERGLGRAPVVVPLAELAFTAERLLAGGALPAPLRTNDLGVAAALAVAAEAVAILPLGLGRTLPTLQQLFVLGPENARAVWLVRHPDTLQSAATSTVARAVVEVVHREPTLLDRSLPAPSK
jgi:DNA-binding transcriptional LysR family regulator